MTENQKEQILLLRAKGLGYIKIANEIGISENTVKSFCRRNQQRVKRRENCCEHCGKPLIQISGRKKKRFCSDVCRNKWWNSHLDIVKRKAIYQYTCPNCGKSFEVYGNRHRKYCCHECYVEYRFGGSNLE
ncbi:Zinc-finger protein [Lachnospiraceae bacterium TWA4]|nr:Zinc-finger protein [Lachnospiraceae bacterium TWA4]